MTSKVAGFFKLLIAAQFVLVAAQATAGHHAKEAKSQDIVDTAVAAGESVAGGFRRGDQIGRAHV